MIVGISLMNFNNQPISQIRKKQLHVQCSCCALHTSASPHTFSSYHKGQRIHSLASCTAQVHILQNWAQRWNKTWKMKEKNNIPSPPWEKACQFPGYQHWLQWVGFLSIPFNGTLCICVYTGYVLVLDAIHGEPPIYCITALKPSLAHTEPIFKPLRHAGVKIHFPLVSRIGSRPGTSICFLWTLSFQDHMAPQH